MPNFVDTPDCLMRSQILQEVAKRRVHFNPANAEHCKSLKTFLDTGSWGAVTFHVDFPYTDVPTYVLTMYAAHKLKVNRKTKGEVFKDQMKRREKANAELEATLVEELEVTQN